MKNSFQTIAVMLIGGSMFFGFQTTALAKPATFQATVNPQRLSLAVNAQGGITGNRQVTVKSTRTQVGSAAPCNKIKLLDVVDGGSPSDPSLGTLSLGKKGLCYFKNKTIMVQPFNAEEIQGVCKNVTGVTQRLAKDGLVAAHNTPWSASYLDKIRAGVVEGGVFPRA